VVWILAGVTVAALAAIASDRVQFIGTVMSWAWRPAALASVLLIGAALAIVIGFPRRPPQPGEPTVAEPVLVRPIVPACHSLPNVIAVHSLQAEAGCTSLAFNVGVAVAAGGAIDGRRPRTLCLLRAGSLTASVGLDPNRLTAYFRDCRVSVGDEVVDLAVRHPSGCEVLGLADGVIESSRLGRLVQVLRRHYDLVVIDSPRGDRWVTDKAFEASEVNLLVTPPTDEFVEAMQPWFDMAWEQSLVPRLALVINRVGARPIPKVLLAAFPNHAAIPEDPDAGNVLERPWVLRFESSAGRAIRELVGTLLPLLAWREDSHAA